MTNGRCRVHGGATPSGIAHPRYKGLSPATSSLPPRLLEMATKAADDPDLMDLERDLRVWEARRADLYARLDGKESGSTWKALEQALERMRHPRDEFEEEQAKQAIAGIIEKGAEQEAIWAEVMAIDRHKAQIATMTAKIQQSAAVTADQMVSTILAVMEALSVHTRRHAEPDTARRILMAVQSDVHRLLHAEPADAEQVG